MTAEKLPSPRQGERAAAAALGCGGGHSASFVRGFSERAGPRLRQTSLSNLSLESWQRAPGRGLGGPRSRTGRKQRNLLGAGRPLEEALGSTVESSPPSPRELWRKIQGCPGPGACHATPPSVQPGHWGQGTGPGPAQEHGPAGPEPQEQGRAWGFCFAPFRGVSKRRQRPPKAGFYPWLDRGLLSALDTGRLWVGPWRVYWLIKEDAFLHTTRCATCARSLVCVTWNVGCFPAKMPLHPHFRHLLRAWGRHTAGCSRPWGW